MSQQLKKIKQNNGLAESWYVGLFSVFDRYLHSLIEQGGIFTLILIPIVEFIRASLYWLKSSDKDFKDGMQKIWLNRAYYTMKAVASTIGIGLALSGMMLQGFAVVIAGGYAATLRYLGKTARYAIEGDVDKTERNLQKVLICGLIAGGFTLMAFYTSLAFVGWSMVLAATGAAVLSGTPKLVAGWVKKSTLVPEQAANQAVQPIVSAQHNDADNVLDKSPVRFTQGATHRKNATIAKMKVE